MSTETENKKLLTLISSDNQKFEIDIAAALESQTIKHIVEDDCADNAIPLANVSSEILIKVIEYLKKHAEEDKENKNDKESLKNFDKEFVNNVSQEELFNLILAANYLNIKGLMDLTCQTAADMIKEKTPEEIRVIFNIKNDFTPEEEEEIRKMHAWAHEQENSSS